MHTKCTLSTHSYLTRGSLMRFFLSKKFLYFNLKFTLISIYLLTPLAKLYAENQNTKNNLNINICSTIIDPKKKELCFSDIFNYCSELPKEAHQLLCFKQAFNNTEKIKSSNFVPVKGISKETLADNNTAKTQFGLKTIPENSPQFITSKIVKIVRKGKSLRYIWLENNQIWKELSQNTLRFKIEDSIKITKGSFGSHFLTVNGTKKRIKVRRIE